MRLIDPIFSCSWWHNPDEKTVPNWLDPVDKLKDIPIDERTKINQLICNHVWVDYSGVKEVFQFCRYCDLKREKK